MDMENKLAEISTQLNELDSARTADLAKLEGKMQELLSAVQSLQDEIRAIAPEEGDSISFF